MVMANAGFEAFLQLKKKIAQKLGVPNSPAVGKIAGAVQMEARSKNADISSVEASVEAYKNFESNIEKYRRML